MMPGKWSPLVRGRHVESVKSHADLVVRIAERMALNRHLFISRYVSAVVYVDGNSVPLSLTPKEV